MIHVEGLKFRYLQSQLLFDGLDLSLDGGRTYGLLGMNGAGKTTLLKIMMGMLFPKGGVCRVLGLESCKRQPSMLADMLFVPEEFHAPEMTIRRYVNLYAPCYPSFNREQFQAFMDEMRLADGALFSSFSLGQKKKVILAFALAANTRVLLLDEPVNGLDIPSKVQFRRMLASVAGGDRCIVISTHQLREIEQLFDSVVILDNGKMLLNETIDAISAKLSFRTIPELTTDVLYAEPSMAGYRALLPHTDGESAEINMELLFNSMINNGLSIQKMFNRKNENNNESDI